MKEKVAVATVQGKTYFLIVNKLNGKNISFISLLPGQSVPAKMKLVITTPEEKHLVNHEIILIFQGEDKLDSLIDEVKKTLRKGSLRENSYRYRPWGGDWVGGLG